MQLVQHTATGVGPVVPPPPQGPRGITINVDFGNGPLQTGSAAAPAAGGLWNRATTTNSAGTGPLVSSTNAVTPVQLAFDSLSQFSNNNTAAEIGSNGQFKSLMQDYFYTSQSKNFTLSGLDPQKSYDLYLYGQGDGVGQDSLFTFSDQLANTTYDSPNNNGQLLEGVEYVLFRGKKSDATGQLAFIFSGWGGVGGFNGFQLVEFAPLLAGDYNADGSVDTADYTVWRDYLGAPAGTLPNDSDGGLIGQPQYQAWRSNYGARTGSARHH